ncbi:hypothetical protein ACWEHA_41300 [Amycolatopsis nivea]
MADDRLVRLILCPGAVELIDVLVAGPCRFARLRRAIPRKVLEPALRTLAAEGALRRADGGSWDVRPRRDSVCALTGTGWRLARDLSDLDVWIAACDRSFGD